MKHKLKGLFSNKKGDGLGLIIATVLFIVFVVGVCIPLLNNYNTSVKDTASVQTDSIKSLNNSIRNRTK